MSDETPQEPEETVAAAPADADAKPADADSVEPSADAEGSAAAPQAVEEPVAAEADDADPDEVEDEAPVAPREKPAIPGMDLDVDLVLEEESGGTRWSEDEDPDAPEGDGSDSDSTEDEDALAEPIVAAIQLSADARYKATGKRKTAIARVILKPGTGVYTINGRTMTEFFPRDTLQRNIRQPLEAVGFDEKMDVIARMNGGGVSAQAGALRHGISRALLEADPNLRSELKKRGFLTRDARAKERKKAGLKKARKRPQFSKR
jgi:small subunit ribosomal protein S9